MSPVIIPPPNSITNPRRLIIPLASGVVVLFLALAFGSAVTKRLWSDEAWFASPALNLATKGTMGTDVLETSGTKLAGMKQYTYWIMPFYVVTQAAWYKLAGFGVWQMRFAAALWGLVALAAWYVIMRRLTDDTTIALLTCTLLALDYIFIMAASNGRMDMMCAALGFAGLAAYLYWRETHFNLAVFISHSLVVASGMTHFLGALHLAILLFVILRFDRRRLRTRHFALAAIGYFVTAAAWGWYISHDPVSFINQFTANATTANRMGGFTAPLNALKSEIFDRYFQSFGWGTHSAGHSGIVRFKILILGTYVISLAGALVIAQVRRARGVKTLLALTGISFLIMIVLDGQKLSFYLIHIVPFYTSLFAVWTVWCWRHRWQSRNIPRISIAICIAGLLALQIGGTLYRMKINAHGKDFLPATAYLKHHANANDIIFGSAELGFELGFTDNLVDDVRLGYISGKQPDYVVIEETYQRSHDSYRMSEPELDAHITKQLNSNLRLVYDANHYKIYARRAN